jgi:23S rRNA (pseudouridine1915-N3)-methyltransferase
MMRVIAIGRLRSSPEAALCSRYAARLRPPLSITELAEATGAPAEIRRREAAALLGALPDRAFAVALDQDGTMPSSEKLAELIERWLGLGQPLCFLIGGAEGLERSVLQRADHVLSLGTLTWPHPLVRVMLAEQLFRVRSMVSGHPYHRSGRP